MCLPSRCSETAVFIPLLMCSFFVSTSLPRNGSIRHNKNNNNNSKNNDCYVAYFTSVVGIGTGYGLDDAGGRSSIPGRVKNFALSTSSTPAVGPTQPAIQCVPGARSPGIKRPTHI
jgi:hypothetical protein